jgi:hypothetical protein
MQERGRHPMPTRATLMILAPKSLTCGTATTRWRTAILPDSRPTRIRTGSPRRRIPAEPPTQTEMPMPRRLVKAIVQTSRRLAYAPVSAAAAASSTSYADLSEVGLQAGANAIFYSNHTDDLPADKFMQGVGEMVSSGLKSVGDPLPVTVDASSVSAHDSYGNSLRITGGANGVLVSLSHGESNNINTFLTWNSLGYVQAQVHGPGRPYTAPGTLVLGTRIRMTLWGQPTWAETNLAP